MKKLTIYLMTTETSDKLIYDTANKTTCDMFLRYFNGYTMQYCNGVYTDCKQIYQDSVLMVSGIYKNNHKNRNGVKHILSTLDRYKLVCKQESILYTIEHTKAKFI